jgi:hypothetical protein
MHDSKHVNTGKTHRKTNEEINKPNCTVQYTQVNGVDHADQYLSYYSILRKTVKWSEKVLLFLLNGALFNSFLIYKTLNKGLKEQKHKKFLHEVTRNWITEQRGTWHIPTVMTTMLCHHRRDLPQAGQQRTHWEDCRGILVTTS